MASANPFHGIFETNTYAHARTFRTGFGQKMSDTLFVFTGWVYSKEKRKNHVGFFDYATLMIPYLIDRLTYWCWNYSGDNRAVDALSVILAVPSGIISIITNFVRFASAAVFTFCMSPIVGIVHGISQIWGNSLEKMILSLPLKNGNGDRRCNTSQLEREEWNKTLGEFLSENGRDLEDFTVDADGSREKLKLEFRKIKHNDIFASNECESDDLVDHNRVYAVVDLDRERKDHRDKFDAFLELNVGNLTRKLEKLGQLRFFRSVRDTTNSVTGVRLAYLRYQKARV